MSETVPPSQRKFAVQTLLRRFMRSAQVVAIEKLSPHFSKIELQGKALKDVAWVPGQKVQIAVGAGLTARTYTPMSWDPAAGKTQLLVFSHGAGPGSRWIDNLATNDRCQFFGPRRSLDLSGLEPPMVLFGDETSFALAAAVRETHGKRASSLLEVSDAAESGTILAAIGLGDAKLFERAENDEHLARMEVEISHLAEGGAHFVLTGKAGSIQRIRRIVKQAGTVGARISAKAYWAPGKTGMD